MHATEKAATLASAAITFAFCLLLAAPTFATADHCFSRRVVSSCGSSCATNACVTRTYAAPCVTEVPQYITQNIFYEVGAELRYSPIAPAAVYQAETGQIEREMQRLADKLTDLKQYQYQSQQQYAYQQQPQIVCVPLQQLQQAYGVQTQQYAQRGYQQQQSQQGYQQQQTQQGYNQQSQMAAPNSGIVAAKCAQCHRSNQKARAALDLDKPLACEAKLAMMRHVIDGDMPKGGPRLTPDEVGQLIQELLDMKQDAPVPVSAMTPRPTIDQFIANGVAR